MATETPSVRGRLTIAIVAGVASIGVIVVVAAASGGGSEECRVVDAPPRCLRAWNTDRAARAYGRHNFSFHLYEGALVTYLSPAAEEVGGSTAEACSRLSERAVGRRRSVG